MTMLMNDFYTLHPVETTDSTLKCKVIFNQNHPICLGHFPGQPVVPGVCMMQLVKASIEMISTYNYALRTAPQVKFLRLITPNISPMLTISWKDMEGKLSVQALLENEGACFKMQAIYERL
ncbi:MAG: 3-hydroxyacyl-ACP dehydratase [Bacteroidetes bacterium]|nr:3-hydroxyacyl-ACP dehydratase [Bacteroidota bacterium]